ncbi:DUF1294 domain-containing protein [Ruegeria arenilitoris]|uniref:DUF1294 domain-containing protein n=1 Tax=Ruegeria arenilitoris TaxID=1173585 RepID=UPI0020C3B6D9|nr:DUF1294 domain-containing protein [Ruegeria arenilitoris]
MGIHQGRSDSCENFLSFFTMTENHEISKSFFISLDQFAWYAFRMWIAVIYLWGINTLTLLAFGWDKARARRRKNRVPERRLLWLAALGGSPGAVVGRWIFRHKTRKRGFSVWLFAITGVQMTLIFLVMTEASEKLL